MRVDEKQIVSFSKELWASQLGLNVLSEGIDAGAPTEKTVSSCITVSGPWQGAIVLECPESIARHAAAMLYSVDVEAASDDDIHDALNDLAEMLGKKIRSLLPESSKLSRPSRLVEEAQARPTAGMRDLTEIQLNCEGRSVRIAVLESEPELAAADGAA